MYKNKNEKKEEQMNINEKQCFVPVQGNISTKQKQN